MSTTIDGEADFARLAEPFRRELIAYGYRMLGSIDSSTRTSVYHIAFGAST